MNDYDKVGRYLIKRDPPGTRSDEHPRPRVGCSRSKEDTAMSDAAKHDIPWVDSNLVTENFNKFPREELLKYAGRYVAFSLDGSVILAGGADEVEMEERLKELGIDPSRVIGTYVPAKGEDTLF
jgi:hypothetical protein